MNKQVLEKRRNRFIKHAQMVHGEKYDYSNVQYLNNQLEVEIICKTHGPFQQKPAYHINGNGCRKCATEKRTFSTPIFIEKATAIHGNKYDYSRVVYTAIKDDVEIICPIHGLFTQMAKSHSNFSQNTKRVQKIYEIESILVT